MALFRTDSVALSYSNIEAAKQWWIDAFSCNAAKVPPDWDNPLPSDVALKLPGDSEPTILLSAQAEVEQAGFDRPSPVVSIIFSDKLKKAHEQLSSRGILAGPIQEEATCSSLKSVIRKGISFRSATNPNNILIRAAIATVPSALSSIEQTRKSLPHVSVSRMTKTITQF